MSKKESRFLIGDSWSRLFVGNPSAFRSSPQLVVKFYLVAAHFGWFLGDLHTFKKTSHQVNFSLLDIFLKDFLPKS